jgi:hypothetical protein
VFPDQTSGRGEKIDFLAPLYCSKYQLLVRQMKISSLVNQSTNQTQAVDSLMASALTTTFVRNGLCHLNKAISIWHSIQEEATSCAISKGNDVRECQKGTIPTRWLERSLLRLMRHTIAMSGTPNKLQLELGGYRG